MVCSFQKRLDPLKGGKIFPLFWENRFEREQFVAGKGVPPGSCMPATGVERQQRGGTSDPTGVWQNLLWTGRDWAEFSAT